MWPALAILMISQASAGAVHNTGAAAACAFSPDGRRIAVALYRQVVLLNASNGARIGVLNGPIAQVNGVRFSRDGKRIAACGGLPGRFGELCLWDAVTLRPQGRFQALSDAFYGLDFGPTSNLIVVGSYDHRAALWDLPQQWAGTSPKPRILKDHIDSVYAAAYSPKGDLIATAAGDRTVKVWDAKTGRRRFTLSESTGEVHCVAFSPDGKRIAAGGADKSIRVWALGENSGTLQRQAFAHEGTVLQVVFTPDGRSLLTSGEDRVIKRFDASALVETKTYPPLQDWPHGLAVSPDGSRIAVSQHNGALVVLDSRTGVQLMQPLSGKNTAAAAPPQKLPTSSGIPGVPIGTRTAKPRNTGGPTLFTASLSATQPTGLQRGTSVRMTLLGARINNATQIYFDDPGISGRLVSPPDPNPGVLRVDVTASAGVAAGLHRLWVRTPLGATGSVVFHVSVRPEVAQKEPNNTPQSAQPVPSECTVIGALDQPGDIDCYTIAAKRGEEIVCEVTASAIRSRLQPVVTVLSPSGVPVAESRPVAGRTETAVGFRAETDGGYTLRISDFDGAGGGDVTYRLQIGHTPLVTGVWPLGLQKGTTGRFTVTGFNVPSTPVHVTAPAETSWGRTIPLPIENPLFSPALSRPIAIGDDPELLQKQGNTTRQQAQLMPVPGVVNGRLEGSAGVSNYYSFTAKRGQKLIVDVMARRLGSPLDSEIEILDSTGKPVERAVLRAVAQTEMTLNDRDSSTNALRIFNWDDIRLNDYVLVGREVIQVTELPKGPDDDMRFRSYRGQRLGFFGTTPEFHSVGSQVYKVQVHPAGSSFSPNGYPLTRLTYTNDDGGPLYGKDSCIDFTAPADGTYTVRITDARGLAGNDFAYRLSVHPPRPDFRVNPGFEHINVPSGAGATILVESERYDGFNGPIEVALEGLPSGYHCSSTTIEAGENSAILLITADENAPPMDAPVRLTARAAVDGKQIVHTAEAPYGGRLFTALSKPDIRFRTNLTQVTLTAGAEADLKAVAERLGNFGGRIPVLVQNLPFGVRVQNVGLNGVLITEEETERTFTLYAESFVKPMQRLIYVLGNVEGGVAVGAEQVLLTILPAKTEPRSTAAR
jgi:WD40 repeat protein